MMRQALGQRTLMRLRERARRAAISLRPGRAGCVDISANRSEVDHVASRHALKRSLLAEVFVGTLHPRIGVSGVGAENFERVVDAGDVADAPERIERNSLRAPRLPIVE